MSSLPLPSHIHYELLLQLLERQTLPALTHNSPLHEQVQQIVINLRKALAQQKQLESSCTQAHLPIEYRWSLNASSTTNGLVTGPLPQNDVLNGNTSGF